MNHLCGFKNLLVIVAICYASVAVAQTPDTGRAITMPEYEKAKTFAVKDLDKDTYIKFENAYILDRYEGKKPYFITGDDGLKKRIDLYKLVAKQGMQTLGTMIFYTNETGKLYKAVLPGLNADPKIWEQYFEDIHAIDKEEKNFVLKLSYVLSKELSFQIYKAEGKPVSKQSATYGNDICFPGDNEVELADGTTKLLKDMVAGDRIKSYDPVSQKESVVTVQSLTVHEPKNYAVTELELMSTEVVETINKHEVIIHSRQLKATPNHPVKTSTGVTTIGNVKEGDRIVCYNEKKKTYQQFTVWNKREFTEGVQSVYNIVADGGESFIMNSVIVLQKEQEN
jgi:hypothetical protein